jgi:hypothetical protein
MMNKLTSAIDRLFRSYMAYCTNWTEDSLFHLLASLHSLDDKLNAEHGRLMFDIPEYIALKALRNYFHHEDEIRSALRVKSLKGAFVLSDLAYACIVSQSDCDAALEGVPAKFRTETERSFKETFKYWGMVIDINPCIFNCMVKIYGSLSERSLSGDSEEFQCFESQLEFEAENGHSHFVNGIVSTNLADVSRVQGLMQELYDAAS